ncbi:MAG: hypothetical protein KGL19_08565 [Bacteroidota bacterium]|nr:hypothetical protein [Bacteroidota bacterium]
MKKINIITAIILLVVSAAFAEVQNKPTSAQGLYLTIEDFLNHHLSYSNGNKIILNEFLASAKIKVITTGESKTLAKKQVFGYHNSNNEDYRFYKNELYQIITTQPWFVYKHYASTSVQGGKGNIKKEFYYFSIAGTDELIPLTVENLKKSFPDNLKFHDLLDLIKNDDDLVSYDSYRNELKVEYLYQKSLQ